MRVVHVISSLHVGGAERLLTDLALAQDRSGHNVEILTLARGGALAEEFRGSRVQLHEFELRSGPLISRLREALRFCAYVRGLSSDVLHGWMYHAGLAVSLLARTPSRVVVGVHHDDPADATMGVTRHIARLLGHASRRVGAIVYVSASARTLHQKRGWSAAKGVVVHGGIDPLRFRVPDLDEVDRLRSTLDPAAEPGDRILVSVARDHPDKDHETLLRAFASLRQRVEHVRLWLAGRGLDSTNDRLTRMSAELDIVDAVVFIGPTDAPEQVLGAADVAVVSSRTESFGLVLIEGMMCGLAAASTRVGIAPMLLPDELLADVGDHESLAQAMHAALQCDRGDLAAAVSPFSTDHMAKNYDAVYERLASNRDDS